MEEFFKVSTRRKTQTGLTSVPREEFELGYVAGLFSKKVNCLKLK